MNIHDSFPGKAASILRRNLPLVTATATMLTAIVGAWFSMRASVMQAVEMGERAEDMRRIVVGDPHDPSRPGLVSQVRDHERIISARLPVSVDVERRVGLLEAERATRAEILRRLDRIEASNQAILERVARIEGR